MKLWLWNNETNVSVVVRGGGVITKMSDSFGYEGDDIFSIIIGNEFNH